jgi:hypothetical protein
MRFRRIAESLTYLQGGDLVGPDRAFAKRIIHRCSIKEDETKQPGSAKSAPSGSANHSTPSWLPDDVTKE